ncbi:hypothetical protein [Paenibacillus sp. Marseille-Q4541]|uniref:hypothetical protein n=1 Tax=Paenibacillus sp. Marseille-Q4541 TaxID=2831522 RepID=UPI001BA9C416|nr:hypothetical protein [Paenibacillus sp. Marseille-Q4541]
MYRTQNQKLGYGIFEDQRVDVKWVRSGGYTELLSDNALTWSRDGGSEGEVKILYGAVVDSKITQVIIVSEGNKSANIIDHHGIRIWYGI